MIKSDVFMLVPFKYFDILSSTFYLMPDSGDCLPIERLQGIHCWNGDVYDPKVSRIENDVVIPQYSVLVRCRLDNNLILDIKTQTTEFLSGEAIELINEKFPEAGEIIATEAKRNLTMNTVNDLQINKMYAGRYPEEVVWLWPELAGKFHDIVIM